MAVQRCELLVIGGGTGGLRAALYAANHGHKTILLEPGTLGGTCLNRGCIPTKAMLQASHLYSSLGELKEFGINVTGGSLNFSQLMRRVHSIRAEGQRHIGKSIKNATLLKVIKSRGKFIDQETVQAGSTTIKPEKVIIATGARTFIPPIPGLEKVKYITSDELVELKKLPKSIILLGGGYISMEFATFFSDLGTKVTVIERNERILKMLDPDVTDILSKEYEERGVNFLLSKDIVGVKQQGSKRSVTVKDLQSGKQQTVTAEVLAVATGRAPNTGDLNLHAAGIAIGKRGGIQINDFLQTSNYKVYAMGDCTGKAMFAHAVKRESHHALINALEHRRIKMDFARMPWAVFTNPPVAGIGLSESQARDQKFKYGLLKAPFTRAGRAAVMGDTRGFVKVIFNKRDRKILGAVIIGPRADDIIHEYVTLLNSNSPTIDVLQDSIHIHPTLSEVMDALKEV